MRVYSALRVAGLASLRAGMSGARVSHRFSSPHPWEMKWQDQSLHDHLLSCLEVVSCLREISFTQRDGCRFVGQVGLTLLLYLPREQTIGLRRRGWGWVGGVGRVVLHNIIVFVKKLTPAVFLEGGFFKLRGKLHIQSDHWHEQIPSNFIPWLPCQAHSTWLSCKILHFYRRVPPPTDSKKHSITFLLCRAL